MRLPKSSTDAARSVFRGERLNHAGAAPVDWIGHPALAVSSDSRLASSNS